jgi:hypothetical protein
LNQPGLVFGIHEKHVYAAVARASDVVDLRVDAHVVENTGDE